MSQDRVDFAIIGNDMQAQLLAGMLAAERGKSCLLIGRPHPQYRLARSVDLSTALLTRPESWMLLKKVGAEAVRIITRIGQRRSWHHVDPLYLADRPDAVAALGHVRHMAMSADVIADPAPKKAMANRTGIVLRDAVLLDPAQLQPPLDKWLTRHRVQRLAADTPLILHDNGSVTVHADGTIFGADKAVLADDEAILAHLPEALWPPLLQPRPHSSIAGELPAALPSPIVHDLDTGLTLPAPIVHDLDTGLTLLQHRGGAITAFGPGSVEQLALNLDALLGDRAAFRQTGQSRYQRIITADGAPAVGRLAGHGPHIIAGFGPTGAFFTPALARWLAGVGTPAEDAWLQARLITRDFASQQVADIGSSA